MEEQAPDQPMTSQHMAHDFMKSALESLRIATPSRECSLAITQLETAMMWNNKDRANKGELEKSETHV